MGTGADTVARRWGKTTARKSIHGASHWQIKPGQSWQTYSWCVHHVTFTSHFLLCQEFQGLFINKPCFLGLCHCRFLKANFWNKRQRFSEWPSSSRVSRVWQHKWGQRVGQHLLSYNDTLQLRRSEVTGLELPCVYLNARTQTTLQGKPGFQTQPILTLIKVCCSPKVCPISERYALCTSLVLTGEEAADNAHRGKVFY